MDEFFQIKGKEESEKGRQKYVARILPCWPLRVSCYTHVAGVTCVRTGVGLLSSAKHPLHGFWQLCYILKTQSNMALETCVAAGKGREAESARTQCVQAQALRYFVAERSAQC